MILKKFNGRKFSDDTGICFYRMRKELSLTDYTFLQYYRGYKYSDKFIVKLSSVFMIPYDDIIKRWVTDDEAK